MVFPQNVRHRGLFCEKYSKCKIIRKLFPPLFREKVNPRRRIRILYVGPLVEDEKNNTSGVCCISLACLQNLVFYLPGMRGAVILLDFLLIFFEVIFAILFEFSHKKIEDSFPDLFSSEMFGNFWGTRENSRIFE